MNYDEKVKQRMLKRRKILENGCWLLEGLPGFKYACLRYHSERITAHRLSLKLFKPEEFKEYLNVNHKCDVKGCWNPDHLYAGDQSDNLNDVQERDTLSKRKNTSCINGHEYVEGSFKQDGNQRTCLICKKQWERKRVWVSKKVYI